MFKHFVITICALGFFFTNAGEVFSDYNFDAHPSSKPGTYQTSDSGSHDSEQDHHSSKHCAHHCHYGHCFFIAVTNHINLDTAFKKRVTSPSNNFVTSTYLQSVFKPPRFA